MKSLAAPARQSARPAVRRVVHRVRPAQPSQHHGAAVVLLGAQPALTVGAMNDPLEREAEVNAERVACGGQARVGSATTPVEPPRRNPVRREGLGGQPSLDQLDQMPPLPKEQQDPAVPQQADVPFDKVSPADMKEIGAASGGDADPAPAPAAGGDDDAADEPAQASRADDGAVAEVGPEGGAAPADVAARVASPGMGRPLPATVRTAMEASFSTGFGAVRIHDAPGDRQDSARLGARAFTHGRHIWLGPGETVNDRRLMAHELTHVVQQTQQQAAPAATPPQRLIRRDLIGAEEIEAVARRIPIYNLLTVVIGRSPITGQTVPRTPENLVHGIISLIPGGHDLFEQLKQAGIIDEAFNWVSEKLNELNLTLARVKAAVAKAWELFNPLSLTPTIKQIAPAFAPLLDDITNFAIAAKDKVVSFVIKGALKLAGPYGEQIWALISKARDTIKLIADDPLAFAKSLARSVVGGFKKFGSNILQHLKRGLMGWLFGAIEGADLKMPAKLDLRGLLSIGFQLLGLTWQRIRARLAKNLDPAGEQKIGFIEKGVEVVKTLVTEGFAGIWRKMMEYIQSFKQVVIEGIKSFVITKLVEEGIKWLIGLSNPVGALIKLAMSIYNLVVVFLERLKQIMELANSLFDSMGAIAAGRIEAAIDKVEETIGRTVPVVISFVAGFLGLNGIASKIRDIIKKLRKPVDTAIDKVSQFLIKKAKLLFSKLIGKLNRKKKLPSTTFQFGKKTHRLFVKKKGKGVEVMLASKPRTAKDVADETAALTLTDPKDKRIRDKVATEVRDAEQKISKSGQGLDLNSQTQNQSAKVDQVEQTEEKEAQDISSAGADAEASGNFDTNVESGLLRANEDRDAEVEGLVGTYGERRKDTKRVSARTGRRYSDLYHNDHIIEKQFAHAVFANLDKFGGGKQGNQVKRDTTEAQGGKPIDTAPEPFGRIGVGNKDISDAQLPVMTIFHRLHDLKNRDKTAGKADAASEVATAAKAAEPRRALKEAIARQLKAETDFIGNTMRQDRSAPAEVVPRIEAGLKWIAGENTRLFGLDAAAPKGEPEAAKAGKPGEDKSIDLSSVPMGGDGKLQPDFQQFEGKYGPYGERKRGYGSYINDDHVISKGWPEHAKVATLGAAPVGDQIEASIKSTKTDLEDPVHAKRRKALLAAPVFPEGHPIHGLGKDSLSSIAIYRPIHLRVTSAEPGPKEGESGLAGVDQGHLTRAVGDYMESGGEDALQSVQKKVQDKTRLLFETKTQIHVRAIIAEYKLDFKRLVDLNPGALKPKAEGAIASIAGRVDTLGRDAVEQNKQMFGG